MQGGAGLGAHDCAGKSAAIRFAWALLKRATADCVAATARSRAFSASASSCSCPRHNPAVRSHSMSALLLPSLCQKLFSLQLGLIILEPRNSHHVRMHPKSRFEL
jgi:hypothetical protein